MKTRMKTITDEFTDLYVPFQAILIKKHVQKNGHSSEPNYYVESYDFDAQSKPINAHPLSVAEAEALAKRLYSGKATRTAFLKPTGLLPKNVLSIDPTPDTGSLIWFTKAQKLNLFFAEKLGIPSGTARIPALLWVASKTSLRIFALNSNRKPTATTPLYYAPFFNIGSQGSVCMGSVDVAIGSSTTMQQFMKLWQSYFFNSKFSHLTGSHNPVTGNVVQLWNELIDTDTPFPTDRLKKSPLTLKNLLQ